MNMKMLRLFSTEEESDNEFLEEMEVKDEKQKDPIMDIQLVEYIIKEFPEIAGDIKESLANLKNTLEKSIDFIEDKSCEIIKESRDFKLSGKYREASIELYDIGNDITSYVDWMENNIKDYQLKEDVVNASRQVNNTDGSITEKLQSSVDNVDECVSDIDEEKFILIYEDFTATQPCLFNLDKFRVEVENWDDMVVKTA